MLRMITPALAIVALVADTGAVAARSHHHGGRAGLMAVARISGMFGLPLPLGHYRGRRHGLAHHHHHGEPAVAQSRDGRGVDRVREAAAKPAPQHISPLLLTNAALTHAPARGSARRAARTTFRGGLAGERRAAGPGLVIGWAGATFWPYAQRDVLDYVFQPHAYDVFWPYAYDDVYSGLFWPYGPTAFAATGARQSHRREGGDAGICAGPGPGPEALARVGDTIRPTAAQKVALDDLKNAAKASADFLRSSCPTELPATPMGRLMAMRKRAQVMLRAVLLVSPAYHAFYQSLTAEQKARFDTMPPVKESRKPEGAVRAMGAQAEVRAAAAQPAATQGADPAADAATVAAPAGDAQATAATADPQAMMAQGAAAPSAAAQAALGGCGGAVQGASPLDGIAQAVRPTPEQRAALGELKQAAFKAAYLLKADCSGGPTPPPNGRIDAMRLRLFAVVEALNLMRPALAKFTLSLSDEQKRRLDSPLGDTRR
jgi:hypothetical protein